MAYVVGFIVTRAQSRV